MSYELFVKQLAETEAEYPKLGRKLIDDRFVLTGELEVIDKKGKLWETYGVEIHYTNGFPHRFPWLYETSGKIPKIGDWHIYEDTLTCCVKVEPAEIIRCIKGITIVEYIKEEALPYFFNQTHRKVEGYYVNGEYGHGPAGICQFYSEELNTGTDLKKMLQLMHYIATHERPDRTAKCFCGNKAKFRQCHRAAFEKLKLIGNHNVLQHGLEIGKAFGIF